MSHPITKNRKALYIYVTIWFLVLVINTLIIMYGQDFSLFISFTDALVSNILFGFLGLLVWYPTRYIPFKKQTPVYSISAHISAGVVVILVVAMTLLWVL